VRHRAKLVEAARWLKAMNIGGTAVGTGINAESGYPALMVKHLREITGLDLEVGEDRVQLMQSMGDIATFSGALRAWVLDLNKLANDIRLMASGPRTGLAEIGLPAVQPGSSIMPGKVNPSIAEMVNQVCYQALGCDVTVAMAAEAGQLELNVMMPVMAWNALHASTILRNAMTVFTERCVRGIQADEARCRELLDRSTAVATALSPYIGYAATAEIAKTAVKTGRSIADIVRERGLIPEDKLAEILSPDAMTSPGIPGK
jgi:aspartate ammonia-lyase